MKKSILAVNVLAAFCGVAHAQSSVTLFGLIDEGLNYTPNVGGKSLLSMSSGDTQGSRWGLKGSEVLGGGLSAVFKLENGFNINNGKFAQEGQEFGRQAWVGVSSTRFGTLTLGRQYDSLVDYLGPLTANGNWGGGVFTHPYDNDNTDDTFRLNNSVKFASVNYSGFTFGGAYAFSNSTGFATNRAESLGAQYSKGSLTIGAAFLNVDSPNNGSAGAVANLGSSGTDGSWTAARQRVFGAGINYTIGAAIFGFVYTNTNLSQPTGTEYANFAASPSLGAASSLKFNNFEVNALYQITPAFFVSGMYTYTQARYDGMSGGSGAAKYHQVGLMADDNVPKRTDLYAQAGYVKVASDSGMQGTGLEFAANPDAAAPSSNDRQVIVRVAIRHKF